MPLSTPLPQLKRQLEELLLDLQHLVTALQQLRDLLPEHSEKRVTVLTLLGRLNDANKKALRGTLDNTALQTEYNAIRADLSDFIQALEEADFDDSAKNDGPKPSAAKQGNVLYRIPHTMPLQVETECVVRIALDEDAIVEEIAIDNQVVLKNLARVSDLMQVELGDPAREAVFAIRSTSPAQQLITDEGYTQWFFYVEPLRAGVHPLEVKVSVLELALNQVHRKEIVFRETIQIVTAGAPGATAGFKSAGQAFSFGNVPDAGDPNEIYFNNGVEAPQVEPPPPPAPPPPIPADPAPTPAANSGLRTVALFLAFIVLGSTATWAFTPSETRDWWVASIIQDDAAGYAAYLEKHPDSPYQEKAVYYRAERTDQLADLRTYQEKYPDGKYIAKIRDRVNTLETNRLAKVSENPTGENIRQFAADFPDSDKLSQVKQAAEARTENRAELMAAVEDAYVKSARTKPTATKITNYLHDFPQHDRLSDVTEAAAAKPEVMAKVQSELEDAYLKKIENDPTPAKAIEFLDKFPEPVKIEKFEKAIEQRPAVKREALKKMRKLEEARSAAQELKGN